MSVHNKEIAEMFRRLADLLEIRGENPFRVRAYRAAAQTVESLPRSAQDMLEDGEDLSELPDIGEDLAGKIKVMVETGEFPLLKQIEKETPAALSAMMKLSGLGPKRVQTIYRELQVESLDELRTAAEQHKIQELEGFGEKTEEKILKEIAKRKDHEQRTKRADVIQVAESLVDFLEQIEGVKKVVVAGSYRRCQETVGDLDILVTARHDSLVMDKFVGHEDVEEVVSHGKTRSTVILRSGLQVDLRVVAEVCFGAALHYFTGDKQHNIAIRKMGQKRGLKINEYGVFKGEDRVAGKTEEEVYEQVGLPYIPPELRTHSGAIEAAQNGKLPELIEPDDLRGNLHTHTDATDGKFSLKEMAQAAKDLGFEYLAITDHSQALSMAHGLNEKRLRQQADEIEKLNDELNGIRILKGIEVDILEDGSLDLEEDVLGELDVVVASVHSKFDLSRKKQTERMIRAMDCPAVHILGHPTGRLINERDPYDVDIEQVLEAAKERGVFMELNAQPQRLDLKDTHCRLAKEMGVKIAISADAHTKTDLEFLKFGIEQARRGWLERDDVLNTRKWADLKKLLKRD
jgi:DNA polymerase (family 10)